MGNKNFVRGKTFVTRAALIRRLELHQLEKIGVLMPWICGEPGAWLELGSRKGREKNQREVSVTELSPLQPLNLCDVHG